MTPAIQTVAGEAPPPVPVSVGDTPGLEVALLRRSLGGLCDETDACARCERHMLIGELVYERASGEIVCALCREFELSTPAERHRVHGPAFGHSIRVITPRAA